MSYTIKKNLAFSTVLLYLAIVLGIVGMFWIIMGKTSLLKGSAGLSVESLYGDATVYVDGEELGDVTVDVKDIVSGEHTVLLKNESRQYEVSLDFLSGTQVAVNRDLGVSDVFSSGQNFWIEKNKSGTVFSVISEPANASVYIDTVEVGTTPYSSNILSDGEYDLRVDLSGYESQTARINIKKGYKINMSVNLFPLPISSQVKAFEDSENLYSVVSDNDMVTSAPQDWVEAILYWNGTRGVNLEGLGLKKETAFDYFLDYNGNLYTKEGVKVTNPEYLAALVDAKRGAYLGRFSDGSGITDAASESYQTLMKGVVGGKTAVIQPTGLGWLRVRSAPGLSGDEVAKATVGDEYAVLEEGVGWVKIKVSDEVVGWVSADYAKIAEN